MSPISLDANITVDHLKLASSNWNIDLLKDNLMEADVDCILSLPSTSPLHDDSLLWHVERSGNYSVHIGYRVGRSMIVVVSSSGLDNSKSWWKDLWRLHIPSKIKIFMCWASHHWLPTRFYLARRGVPLDETCPRCLRRSKSMVHALWSCRSLTVLRSSIPFLKELRTYDGMHFHDFMLIFFKTLTSMELELLCVIFWRVWFCRNQLVYSMSMMEVGEVVDWATTISVKPIR
ncbi:hypothetical protein Ddye_027115 [Dipteronia dyeriana]|uniref:Reverse transcriptase zinc-binding domain-containing protein n=1 Tax=Dipteronia dyeriana TaxID=168575 RepID=A0AAD9TNH7_9ROSI|nr:hypothetical protein Ddye_027115 [Dipteronia dyeriana]